MKKYVEFFVKQFMPKLDTCTEFQLSKEESDSLFGGFKEYVPPIYEQEEKIDQSFRINDLLTDINKPE